MWLGQSEINNNFDNNEVPFSMNFKNKTYFVWENFVIVHEKEIKSFWKINFNSMDEKNLFEKQFMLKTFKKINNEIFHKNCLLEEYENYKNNYFQQFFNKFEQLNHLYQTEIKNNIVNFEKTLNDEALQYIYMLQEKLMTIVTQSIEYNNSDQINYLDCSNKLIVNAEKEFNMFLENQTYKCFDFLNKIDDLRTDIDYMNNRLDNFSRY